MVKIKLLVRQFGQDKFSSFVCIFYQYIHYFILSKFSSANKPIWSSMKSNSLQDLNQSIWNIVFIQLDQQITNQSESTLSDYKVS